MSYQNYQPGRPAPATARPTSHAPQATSGGVAVSTINVKGKQYVPVSERVRLAHASAEPFAIISSEVLPIGETGRCYVRVGIQVGERTYYGSAEIKLEGAKAGSADAEAPLESAESGALARALGFAGFGLLDSAASA